MASVSWKAAASGTWSTGANWSTGTAPGANDVVSIGIAGAYTVSVSAAASAYALAMTNIDATLALAANLTLSHGFSATQSGVDIASGTLSVTGGAVTLGTNNYVYHASYGPTIDGPGVFATAAPVTTTIVSGPVAQAYSPYWELLLGGGVTWSNSGTVADSGAILVGDSSGGNATIANQSTGLFEFLGPYSNLWISDGASASFANAGTIVENTGNGGATAFGASLQNTGTIDLQSGTLDLTASNSIGGTITGGGVLEFASGVSTLTAATSGNLLISGGAVVLKQPAAITGNISETTGALSLSASGPANVVINASLSDTQGGIGIAGGKTLTISGAAVSFGTNNYVYHASYGPTIDGPGTLATGATVTTTIVSGPVGQSYSPYWELLLGGGVTWSNSGTVNDSGGILIGDASGGYASIVNQSTGVFDFLAPYSNIWLSNGASATFSNAGTIVENTGGSGPTSFAAALTNTGVIDLKSGILDLVTSSTIGGTVTGGGVLEFSSGVSTLTAATSGNLLVSGGALVLAQTGTITGNISETTGAISLATNVVLAASLSDTQGSIALAAGKTLTVSASTVTLGTNVYVYHASYGPTIDGPGTFATGAAVTTTIVSGPVNQSYSPYWELALGGGATWSNSGTVMDSGAILIGDASGGSASITNAAGGVFQFLSSYSNIWVNTGASGLFSNAGTIVEANSGGGITAFQASLKNTGLIDLQAGTLDLQAGSTIGGTVTGSGILEFSAGTSTLTAATSGNILVGGGVLTLGTTSAISGALTDDGGTIQVGSSVNLSGVLVDQAGLIAILGGKLTSKAITINGGATLSGYGAVSGPVIDNGIVLATTGTLAIGANSSGSGIFEIAGGAAMQFNGAATASHLSFLTGGAETLLLATPKTMQATLTGFGATDTIDLLKVAATGLSYANNTLTVTGSSGTLATLGFVGTYAKANFGLKSDGAGGTDIIFKNTTTVSPPAVVADFTAASAVHLPAMGAVTPDPYSISVAAHTHFADALPAFDLLHPSLLL
jgi:hypothetical protein